MEDQHSTWAAPLALEYHLNTALREADLDKSTQRSTREKTGIEMGLWMRGKSPEILNAEEKILRHIMMSTKERHQSRCATHRDGFRQVHTQCP